MEEVDSECIYSFKLVIQHTQAKRGSALTNQDENGLWPTESSKPIIVLSP